MGGTTVKLDGTGNGKGDQRRITVVKRKREEYVSQETNGRH